MSVIDVITQLTQEDIRIWLTNGQLRFSAPASGLSDTNRDLLIQHKAALIDFLATTQSSNTTAITAVNSAQLQPLSFSQERIWFLHKLQANTSTLHLPGTLLLSGSLDIAHLTNAFSLLIKRHGILRTAYIETAAGVFQKTLADIQNPLQVKTLSTVLNTREIAQQVQQQTQENFDLHKGEVCKATLLVMPQQQFALILSLHHIAGDAWSLGILTKELAIIYQALLENQQPNLAELFFSYVDYAVWQRANYAANTPEKHLLFWQSALADQENFSLPMAVKPKLLNNFSGDTCRFVIPQKLTQKLNLIAKEQNTTLFVVLLSMLGLLLYRYSQQSHFCIGTPSSGRQNSDSESVLGCFLNILALPLQHESSQTLQSLLQHNHEMFTQVLLHQHTPFEEVVRAAAKRRDLHTSPLFQIMFGLQNSPLDNIESLSDLSITSLSIEKTASTYDINISAKEWLNELHFEVDYKTGIYAKSTISALFEHFIRLLELANTHLHLSLGDIDFLSTSDLPPSNNILQRPQTSLISLLEQQCKKTPNATALIFGDTYISFSSLNQQANQLAHYLKAQGIHSTSRVGILQKRSPELIISLLAIIKTGASYVPIDTDFPPQRIQFIIDDAQLNLLISHSDILLDAITTPLLLINNDTAWQTYLTHNVGINVTDNSLFNIIYTSGSTGNPKGVMMGHNAIVNRLLWMQEQFSLAAADCVLQKTPVIFDVSIWEIFWPLITGARLLIAKPNDHKNPADIAHLVKQHNVTVIHFVPSMLAIYLATQETYAESLRYVFSSGETLSPNTNQLFYNQFPHCQLINLYGPTEAAIDVSFYQCQKEDTVIPIGKAISNTQLYVVDQQQKLMPMGAVGEIAIAGECLAFGYLNNKALTESRFIDNPFTIGKLYLTGDYGYWDNQQNLHFLGRQDLQIKIRGLRVELGEIEAFLMQYPAMINCKAIVKMLVKEQQTIIAYYQCAEPTTAQLLRHFLAEHTPSFMLPNLFVEVQTWPLLANGKINISALPHPDNVLSQQTITTPATTAIEKKVAAIWMELLDISDIDIHDNFFELGGHSLMALIALNKIQAEFSIRVSLSSIFYEPTIANVALIIEQILASAKTAEEIII